MRRAGFALYLVYKLYRSSTPFDRLGGDHATVNDCADATAILMSSGGPGAANNVDETRYKIVVRAKTARHTVPSWSVQHVIAFEPSPAPIRVYAATFSV